MVLIKYSGKYVKIYFNMKITYLSFFAMRANLQITSTLAAAICQPICSIDSLSVFIIFSLRKYQSCTVLSWDFQSVSMNRKRNWCPEIPFRFGLDWSLTMHMHLLLMGVAEGFKLFRRNCAVQQV